MSISRATRVRGRIMPTAIRTEYRHLSCGGVTTIPQGAAEVFVSDPVYAADKFPDAPNFKTGCRCATCGGRFALVFEGRYQFVWTADGSAVVDPTVMTQNSEPPRIPPAAEL
jgi:hypothetical protein